MSNAIHDRAIKPIDDALRVHAWTPTGFLNAGLLQLDEDGNHMSASFRYDDAFTSRSRQSVGMCGPYSTLRSSITS